MTRTELIALANEQLDATVEEMESRFGKASSSDVETYAHGVVSALGEHYHEWLDIVVDEETGVIFK